MKTFIVGGFVRDTLLGLAPKDKDFVIVGATQDDVDRMIHQGFQQVGVDFPVFLHPETGDEYALARVERKTGTGYGGFTTETSAGKLNPKMNKAFEELGYDLDKEYDLQELVEVFRRIAQ